MCDSGSTDGSLQLARGHGARVLEIAPEHFTHGGTRNLLMSEARGAHVALLTQDSEPADERWLERLLGGFELAADVALVYGPYRAPSRRCPGRCAWSSSAGSPRCPPTAAHGWSGSSRTSARCRPSS